MADNYAYNSNNYNTNFGNAPLPSAPPPVYSQPGPKRDGEAQNGSYPMASSTTQQPANPVFDLKNFNDRQKFIKKVYLTLGIQLLVTFVPILVCSILKEKIPVEIRHNKGLFWSAWVVGIISFFMLVCCSKHGRRFPMNVILLGIFTVCEAFMLTIISMYYDTEAVAIAVGALSGVVIVVSLMATFTKFDFTKLLPMMFVVIIGWCLCSLALIWVPMTRGMIVVYAGIGVSIFTIFLAIDTKMVIGGGKYEYSEEDYVFAALNLYLDITRIFMYLLMIFGGGD